MLNDILVPIAVHSSHTEDPRQIQSRASHRARSILGQSLRVSCGGESFCVMVFLLSFSLSPAWMSSSLSPSQCCPLLAAVNSRVVPSKTQFGSNRLSGGARRARSEVDCANASHPRAPFLKLSSSLLYAPVWSLLMLAHNTI